jgi:hypothetical protein
MNKPSNTQAEFLSSASALISSVLDEARQADPDGLEGLQACLSAGGLIALRATFAPSTGLASLAVLISEPNGTEHVLSACSLERAKH